jgi:uncharacterized coiled-coil DUF342 family protein
MQTAQRLRTGDDMADINHKIDGLRDEMRQGFKDVQAEFKNVRAEMKVEIGGLREETSAEIAELRQETHDGFKEMRAGIDGLRKEVSSELIAMRGETHDEFKSVRSELNLRFLSLERSITAIWITVGAGAIGLVGTLLATNL